AHRLQTPRGVVEQFMIDFRFRFAADAEGNVAYDVVHDLVDLVRDLFAFDVGENGEIPASDVEADAAQRNLVFVCDDAPDRLRVTFVAVGAQHATLTAGRDAGLDLPDRRVVVLTENFCLRDRFAHVEII